MTVDHVGGGSRRDLVQELSQCLVGNELDRVAGVFTDIAEAPRELEARFDEVWTQFAAAGREGLFLDLPLANRRQTFSRLHLIGLALQMGRALGREPEIVSVISGPTREPGEKYADFKVRWLRFYGESIETFLVEDPRNLALQPHWVEYLNTPLPAGR